MTGRARWTGLLLALALLVVAATAALGSIARVASDGDPYRVSVHRLRSELAATGLDIRYIHPAREKGVAVTGVANYGAGGPIGFEYQIFPGSDVATVRQLGNLKAADFGWKEKIPIVFTEHQIRGVLGNVAFAEYEDARTSEPRVSRQRGLRIQLQRQRTTRALDDALFRSFPPSDPYAHAESSSP